MDIELIDRAWRVLPKEFKEEVKETFRKCLGVPKYEAITIKPMLLDSLFGHHNLTSDEEGEEMVYCPKYKIGSALDYCDELDAISGNSNMRNWGEQMIAYLFGSKCLPDAHEDNFTSIEPKPAEQSMTDSETEHTKDEFATRMQGKFTEQDFTEAKQRTESCMASIPQFELPKQIEAQINKAMESIKAESRKQFGDFGVANADIAIPVYRQMMRLGALLVLSAGDLESEQTDPDRGDYISMIKPTDPNKCPLFLGEKGEKI